MTTRGPATPSDDAWVELIDAVVRDPDRLRLVFQPIVGLAQGEIVGYEALSRFDGPPDLTPDLWFAAADRQGRGAGLEAMVVRRCLELRNTLPLGCFLTVNVSPHLLADPELTEPLLAAGDLSPLVLEFTEHRAVVDLHPLIELRDQLAARGALLALDDAGSGYSGLQQMMSFRPHIIKLDRAIVADIDRDEVKLALAELLGEFGGRIDAWLLAEGIETEAELDAFLRLRVPLGQGYLLGRPAPPWASLDPLLAARLRAGAARSQLLENVASLVEKAPVEGRDAMVAGHSALRVDRRGRPVALLLAQQRVGDAPEEHRVVPVSLRVSASTSVVELARRIVARPEHCRFDPVVCVDDLGRSAGVIRVELVLLRLAELKAGGGRADAPASPPTAVA